MTCALLPSIMPVLLIATVPSMVNVSLMVSVPLMVTMPLTVPSTAAAELWGPAHGHFFIHADLGSAAAAARTRRVRFVYIELGSASTV